MPRAGLTGSRTCSSKHGQGLANRRAQVQASAAYAFYRPEAVARASPARAVNSAGLLLPCPNHCQLATDPKSLGARALVVEGNPSLRRATVAQLRELGIEQVRQCKGLADARLSLEQVNFDFVLCSDFIEGSELSGQALLEELRREAVTPHSTVFVMLAGEATYAKVVEAAEAALDCFILRPYKLNLTASWRWRCWTAPWSSAPTLGCLTR